MSIINLPTIHLKNIFDCVPSGLAAMEDRIEQLSYAKANKDDVVMTTDLEALLTAHATELDIHLDTLKDEILNVVSSKVDKEEMRIVETKVASRMASLENAILKGLKTISDKVRQESATRCPNPLKHFILQVSSALAEKLDQASFIEFKGQIGVVLADVDGRLKDWNPMARGLKVSRGADHQNGIATCLCCDNRVHSANEMKVSI
jgi:hypothetical protein